MSDYRYHDNDLFDTLQDISDAVSEATRTGDYSHLSDTIQNKVADFADSIGEGAHRNAQNIADAIRGGSRRYDHYNDPGNRASYTDRSSRSDDASGGYHSAYADSSFYGANGSGERAGSAGPADSGGHTSAHSWQSYHYNKDTATYRKEEEIRRDKESKKWAKDPGQSYFLQTMPSRRQGLGKRILGGAGSIVAGFYTFFNIAATAAFAVDGSVGAAMAFLILAGGTGALTWFFARMFHRNKRMQQLIGEYYQYASIVGSNEYFYLEDIAKRTGETKDKVADNLLEMRTQQLLPRMKLDQQKTTLMLTEHSYQQYMTAEKARKEREERSQTAADVKRANASKSGTGGTTGDADRQQNGTGSAGSSPGNTQENLSPEVQRILEEGNQYIAEIRRINDIIPDTEEMSNKLYRLEDTMKRIFAQVQKDPSKAKDIRKLMNYYLPTTTKLLRAYAQLPDSPDSGENIRTTRRQIEDSMDSINDAFAQLLDNLFQDEAWDLSSDLNVMKTMMQQDGLIKDDTTGRQQETGESSGDSHKDTNTA